MLPIDENKFWSQVEKTADCWLWTGTLDRKGYGDFRIHGYGKSKHNRAHRIAWLLVRGSIDDQLDIDHLCRVRNCVNPDHMELVTRRVNVLRGIGHCAVNATKTHCSRGHLYDSKNTAIVLTMHGTGTGRRCRTCYRDYMRKYCRKRRACLD